MGMPIIRIERLVELFTSMFPDGWAVRPGEHMNDKGFFVGNEKGKSVGFISNSGCRWMNFAVPREHHIEGKFFWIELLDMMMCLVETFPDAVFLRAMDSSTISIHNEKETFIGLVDYNSSERPNEVQSISRMMEPGLLLMPLEIGCTSEPVLRQHDFL